MDLVQAIEIAQAVFAQYKIDQRKWWGRMDGTPILNDVAVRMAEAFRAAIPTAAPATPSVPEGYVLVPKEMTPEMEKAAEDVSDISMEHDSDLGSQGWVNNVSEMYAAAINAAPQATQPEAAPLDPVAETLMRAGELRADAIRIAAEGRAVVAQDADAGELELFNRWVGPRTENEKLEVAAMIYWMQEAWMAHAALTTQAQPAPSEQARLEVLRVAIESIAKKCADPDTTDALDALVAASMK